MLPCLLALLLLPQPGGGDLAVREWRQVDGRTRTATLALARRAFDGYVRRRETPPLPTSLPPLLRRRAAVFVSAMVGGAPRCCMGSLYPTQADAASEIVEAAKAAAGRDRRFAPIRAGELSRLTLIVSIVGRPRLIREADLAALDPTREGLVARASGRVGVVLSGETASVERALAWARTRAGARPGEAVELSRLDVVRLVEHR